MGKMGLPIDLVIEFFTFAVVVAGTLAVIRGAASVMSVRRRLGGEIGGPAPAGSVIKAQGVRNPFLAWVQSSSSLSDSKDHNKLRRDLAMAGFDHPAAPVWYVITRFALAIGLPLLFIVAQPLSASPI